MFDELIKLALKSALKNAEITKRINESGKNKDISVREKIIDLDKEDYTLLER